MEPANASYEQAVLGAMLIDAQTVPLVMAEMDAGDFLTEIDRRVFSAIRQLYRDRAAIDPVTILAAASDGTGDKTLRAYLLELMDVTPTAANVREYIPLAREAAQRDKLCRLGGQLTGITAPADAIPILQQAEELLSNQHSDAGADMETSLLDFYGDLEHRPQYLPWGFDFLDDAVFAEAKDFVILAGRPSDGKTALALHMAYKQSVDRQVVFFSLETGRRKLFGRLMSSVSGVPGAVIKRRTISSEQYALLAAATEEIRPHKLRIIEAAGCTVDDIEAGALAAKADIVYIDYLQLIAAKRSGSRFSRADEVADISRSLATMARKHGVTVVALSQLSRPIDKTKRREPVLADLRESGQIEQDADVVMFIWRQEENKSNTQRYITLAKNKEGRLGLWPVAFNGALQRFIPEESGETDDDDDEDDQTSFYEVSDGVRTPWD